MPKLIIDALVAQRKFLSRPTLEMDEFGPMDDQEPVDFDEEEAASLLADDGYKVFTKKGCFKLIDVVFLTCYFVS